MLLETERLTIRPIEETDAPTLHPMVNDSEVAATMLSTPHPYPEDDFRSFVVKAMKALQHRERFEMVIVRKDTGLAIGAIRFFNIAWDHQRAEIGYWLGKEHWGSGYATEAAKLMIRFGFEELGLEGIHAYCLTSNTASARVLEKAGLTLEGRIKHGVKRGDGFLDVFIYGIIHEEFAARP